MTNAAHPGDPTPREPARVHARAGRLTLAIAVLAVLLVGAVVLAGVFIAKEHSADERQRDRAAAQNVAGQFALRMDKVDGADFEGYVKGINQLLTTKARAENSKVLDAVKQSYEQAKVKGTGKVLLTGVGDYDEDSATVLVVHDASVQTSQGKLEHHYRWTVDLAKVKGRWLVDDFNQVG